MTHHRAEHLIDLKCAATRLALSPRTIRSHVHDAVDPLPAYRVGGKLLFAWTEVETWLRRRRVTQEDRIDIVDEIASAVSRAPFYKEASNAKELDD